MKPRQTTRKPLEAVMAAAVRPHPEAFYVLRRDSRREWVAQAVTMHLGAALFCDGLRAPSVREACRLIGGMK